MTEIRYYPLIDCDTEGTEKVAMLPTLDYNTIMAQSSLWLEEMIPNYFRLRCQQGQFPSNDIFIRCPRCGKPLARMSETINETTRALYVCGACVKSKEETIMATTITQEFLREHFRKHDSLTLYKPDGTPVTIVKAYEPVLIVGQYESYSFRSNERMTEFCNKHRITTRPTITLG